MAGIVLEYDRFTWLDLDWQKVLTKHNVCSAIHMTDFGKTGVLADVPGPIRFALFTDLVAVINEHKRYSIAATLSTDQHKQYFGKSAKKTGLVSMYSTCFLLLALSHGKQATHDKYQCDIPYLLDDGNEHKSEVILTHGFLVDTFYRTHPVHVGPLSFGDDKTSSALQAADVVTWAVRRKRAGLPFERGLEPVEAVLSEIHLEQTFKEDWMADVAADLAAF